MNIKKGDMVSIKQDFIDRNNRYEYDSRDIWEVKEVYNIGDGYHVAAINNLTGYGNAHLCTYNMDLRTIDDLKARLPQNDNIAKVKNNNINTCKIIEYKEILEKSLSAIQYLRIHGFSTYMESEGIVNRIMMFKDKNEMRDRRIKSIL